MFLFSFVVGCIIMDAIFVWVCVPFVFDDVLVLFLFVVVVFVVYSYRLLFSERYLLRCYFVFVWMYDSWAIFVCECAYRIGLILVWGRLNVCASMCIVINLCLFSFVRLWYCIFLLICASLCVFWWLLLSYGSLCRWWWCVGLLFCGICGFVL